MDFLRCNKCDQEFRKEFMHEDELHGEFAVLSCDCGDHPLVAGIPVFLEARLQSSGPDIKQVVEFIKKGDTKAAFIACMVPNPHKSKYFPKKLDRLMSVRGLGRFRSFAGSLLLRRWRKKQGEYCYTARKELSADQMFDFFFDTTGDNNKDALDYFKFRFGQPRHLTALSFTTIINESEGPILDLACGFGHLTRGIANNTRNRPVIGIDNNFYLLYVAKNWIAPEASYICCSADDDLPLRKDYFSAVICVNSFHFFSDKTKCADELKRVISRDGVIMLLALRHSDYQVQVKNQALKSDEYEQLFHQLDCRTVTDDEVLQCYLRKHGPDLSRSVDHSATSDIPLLSMVATSNKRILKRYGLLKEWPHAAGNLTVNPLYRKSGGADKKVHFHREFPSEYYRNDNPDLVSLLPEKVTFTVEQSDILDAIDDEHNEYLISRCVLLDIPNQYIRG